jgi:Small metal-binding protein
LSKGDDVLLSTALLIGDKYGTRQNSKYRFIGRCRFGFGKTITEHAVTAKTHAQTAKEHLDAGITSLNDAIDHGKVG